MGARVGLIYHLIYSSLLLAIYIKMCVFCEQVNGKINYMSLYPLTPDIISETTEVTSSRGFEFWYVAFPKKR